MIAVLTICAMNLSYVTQGTSYMDGFDIHIVEQSRINFVRACIMFLKLFSFGHMNKSHVFLLTFIVTIKVSSTILTLFCLYLKISHFSEKLTIVDTSQKAQRVTA